MSTEILESEIVACELYAEREQRTIDVYLGIDPGKSGSISAIWSDGLPATSYARGDWTEADQAEWLRQFDLERAVCVIERVSSSPQMGVKSSFTFGASYGFLRGLLAAMQVPYREVSPQTWQKTMGCMSKGDKNKTKGAAQQRWPQMKITHRNADSLLIAEYARSAVKW